MHASFSQKKQQARVDSLQAEVDKLQNIVGADVDAEKLVSKHIKLLHQYNEAKDATQILIGRLAALKQTTIRQIHEDLGLTNED
ncbi:hypothetical protein JAAARDRAFT_202430 [Jaapia argillacea MUCL 33604]|uniref:Swi5-domain-containing protein n=1 Tax=Jaapia argillacea MUCL 33604 TaxID=933084 RepID=A0A067QH90_9AGAM|nr:hypothetical protein JAAARDRAFT_202430 [Jaapia argillacea MUCL 33604]